jgi:hypothetical protein
MGPFLVERGGVIKKESPKIKAPALIEISWYFIIHSKLTSKTLSEKTTLQNPKVKDLKNFRSFHAPTQNNSNVIVVISIFFASFINSNCWRQWQKL